MLKLTIILLLPALASCFLFGDRSNWNGLKVTWGVNPLTSFKNVPRTRAEALTSGWVSLTPGMGCSDNPKFMGERYIKGTDYGVILIYDVAGYIAGIQIGWPVNFSPNQNSYPFTPLDGTSIITDNGFHFATAYFVDPSTICKGGRTAVQFKAEGTGAGLWIQNGTNPVTQSVSIPMKQADVENTKWTKGACFATMGRHYWYDMKKDMNCDYLFPVFLLYNGGVLNGFGWALGMDLKTYSSRIEHPPQNSYGNFMTPPPDCLSNLGTMTTLHIYLTNSIISDTC